MLSRRLLSLHPRIPRRQLSSAPPRIGQPTFESHPHLLACGQVTPGCSALEYAVRRSKLAAGLPPGSVAVIPSADIKYRSGPVFYPFHQDPDFLYLTGFLEPAAVCVIEKTGADSDGQHVFHMMVQEKNAWAELWNGARSGVQAAIDVFNADEATDINHLDRHLVPILDRAEAIYTDVVPPPHYVPPPPSGPQTVGAQLHGRKVVPLRGYMNELRIFKSAAEVANMRQAGRISGRSFNKAIAARGKFPTEKDLCAFLEYEFRVGGCEKEAYVPVVAGGPNALAIHYTRNDDVLNHQDLVLVDAGGQYGNYATDITRTWPISGKFTPPQRDLYQAVLTVQKQCISLCRPESQITLNQIHSIAESALTRELSALGFDVGSGRGISELYPHHVGHHVGLELHDCGNYSPRARLRGGHCVTIEPGVYVPNDNRWPRHFWGMGIRIEDTVCVSDDGPVVLSVEAVKEIVDIEALAEGITTA